MSAERLVLIIDASGVGHCLYDEVIDLQALGVLSCRRASRIEFDPSSQNWQVLTPDCRRVRFRHRSRAKCLQWERENLRPDPSCAKP